MTPSAGLIEAAVAAVAIPVNVMIRPHSRSSRYDENDVAVMLRDIAIVREAGAAGVVFGALTADGGGIDTSLLETVLRAADGLDVTFHRAFDELSDQLAALDVLAKYPRISRILTSGGRSPAPQAMPRLRELHEAAGRSHLRILGGHGLTPDTLEAFIRETGVQEVHFGSAVRSDGTFGSPIDAGKMARVRSIMANRFE
ncbi:copper homeostasis protein CutC [Cohnella sp. GCM10027633]|uniref:copper homeostasis protein CutC n=1 Tax=unclassified Cohnella TaxID=2636738 RepID=UPI0036300F44